MDTNLIITGVIAIILLILIVKFAKNIIKIVLIIIVIAAVAFFGFLHFNQIATINDLHEKYCDSSNEKDSLKCVCIVKPVENDFKDRFTKKEMNEMGKVKFAAEILVSLKNKRKEITEKLKKNKAEGLLDEFKKDFL